MDLNGFIDYLKGHGLEDEQFTVEIDGGEDEACFSGEKYVYYECVVFVGEDDIHSAYQTPYVSEGDLFLSYKDMRISVNFRRIRTFLAPGFEKLYDHSNLDEAPPMAKEVIEEEGGRAMLSEYGLKQGGKYYCHLHYDHYLVDGPEGPVTRTNAILWISDREFVDGEPQVRLTPGYQGWTY